MQINEMTDDAIESQLKNFFCIFNPNNQPGDYQVAFEIRSSNEGVSLLKYNQNLIKKIDTHYFEADFEEHLFNNGSVTIDG